MGAVSRSHNKTTYHRTTNVVRSLARSGTLTYSFRLYFGLFEIDKIEDILLLYSIFRFSFFDNF